VKERSEIARGTGALNTKGDLKTTLKIGRGQIPDLYTYKL